MVLHLSPHTQWHKIIKNIVPLHFKLIITSGMKRFLSKAGALA